MAYERVRLIREAPLPARAPASTATLAIHSFNVLHWSCERRRQRQDWPFGAVLTALWVGSESTLLFAGTPFAQMQQRRVGAAIVRDPAGRFSTGGEVAVGATPPLHWIEDPSSSTPMSASLRKHVHVSCMCRLGQRVLGFNARWPMPPKPGTSRER